MKIKTVLTASVLSAVTLLTGCANGLNSYQKHEYDTMKAKGQLIEDKDPTLGAVLGILPGGGSFYVGEVGLGIVNLLLWPESILWDPISGWNGSQYTNYDVSVSVLRKKERAEEDALLEKLQLGTITDKQYMEEKAIITSKYNVD